VEAVVVEQSHVGKVAFPVTVPDGLAEWIQFPDDLSVPVVVIFVILQRTLLEQMLFGNTGETS